MTRSHGEQGILSSEHAPTADERRRSELAEFLRLRRGRLDPQALGLPPRARRRTPGLRREDVAERAGVSVAWYTSLEQGRPVNPSRTVVTALADALALNETDRRYLYTLAGHAAASTGPSVHAHVELLQRLVDHVAAPAYCSDAHTTVLAWNALSAEIFGDYGQWPSERRTLLRLVFEEPTFGARLIDRDEYAARVVRTFRARSEAHLNDPATIAMIDSLASSSPHFAELWTSHEVRHAETDSLQVQHPLGKLDLTMITLAGLATPGVRFNAYLPADLQTAARLAAISTTFEASTGSMTLENDAWDGRQ